MLVVTNVRNAETYELDIPVDTLLPQDSGAREAAQVQFDLYDQGLAFDLLPEDELVVSTVEDPAVPLVTINVRLLSNDVLAIGRVFHVTGYDSSTLLDRVNVVQDDRPAGESDHDRLAYFMTTYGTAVGLDDDPAGIATLNASMPAQKFRLLTLRQAIEQVLGTALDSATYRINASKKLDTWDTDAGLDPAPFDVVVGTPGAGEIAPENLVIKADTSNLFNAYWVRGATAAGSGWQTDPASIAQWGRREKYIDAPDSDLSWKAFNVGQAALADTAQPLYRGTFTDYSPHDGWRSNQRFALTSPMHDLVAAPFDTVRVTPRFLSGTAEQAYDIEFGSPKVSFTARTGKNARRSAGVGPGSGGWGPGGGFGGGGIGGAAGDCGCPDFVNDCPFATYDDMNRTNASAWGNVSSSPNPTWVGSIVSQAGPGGMVLNDSMVPTHGLMRLSHPSGSWNGQAQEVIAGPGFWSTGDWAMRTSVKVVNTNVTGWSIILGTRVVAWSRGSALLIVTNNDATTTHALSAGTFDGMGFVPVEMRIEGSTLTAVVAGLAVSATTVNALGPDDDLIMTVDGLAVVGLGGAEVDYGPIDNAACVGAPTDGQPFVHQATGDGSTTAYTAPFAFGQVLSVLVDGVDVTSDVTSASPVITFGHAPPVGSGIIAHLRATVP